jgi:hypothetical protein
MGQGDMLFLFGFAFIMGMLAGSTATFMYGYRLMWMAVGVKMVRMAARGELKATREAGGDE